MKKLLVLFPLSLLLVLIFVSAAHAANRSVSCGQDLDAVTSSDGATTATNFILQAGCTYTTSQTVTLKNGDMLSCSQAPSFRELPIRERAGEPHAPDSAYDPTAHCTVQGGSAVQNVVARQGTAHLVGINIQGGNFVGTADSGKALKDGSASDASTAYGVVIRNSEAAGVGNAHGDYNRIELTNTTTDPNALGFTGSGIKFIDEGVIRHSWVHDNQGNGIWCDEGCHDTSKGVWHVNFNVVERNGRDGIRWEFDEPNVSNTGEALIEHNEVHGNGRSGIQARDAGTATIRDNQLGGNAGRLGIKASDSGRSDRYNLQDIDILDNVLNGDTIQGCQLPDSVVFCANNN